MCRGSPDRARRSERDRLPERGLGLAVQPEVLERDSKVVEMKGLVRSFPHRAFEEG